MVKTNGYYSHSDHLGSASFITDASGNATQHLQYLPFGETFVDQRNSSFSSRYTFSAKEKDEETGYSYFGARYYDSDVSVWLSVDPMSDKHPNMGPYTYCNNNPVMLVDPDGNDWFENELTGAIYYNSEMREGQEGTGAMTGKGWKHLGENGMFISDKNSRIDVQYNNDRVLIGQNGGKTWTNGNGSLGGEMMLAGNEAKDFMKKRGYSLVPKVYDYLNDNIEQSHAEGDGPINLVVDNGSKPDKIYSYQYVKDNLYKHPSIIRRGKLEETPMAFNQKRVQSKDLMRDYYSKWPSINGTAAKVAGVVFDNYYEELCNTMADKIFKSKNKK